MFVINMSVFCRCHDSTGCVAYQYTGSKPGNCVIIQSNCTASYAKIPMVDSNSVAFEKGLSTQNTIHLLFSEKAFLWFYLICSYFLFGPTHLNK